MSLRSAVRSLLLATTALCAGALGATAHAASQPPEVVASILPVYALATALAEDPARVHLLVPAGASEHTYALRPSDAAQLSRAQLVVWVGPATEPFLPKALAALPPSVASLSLLEVSQKAGAVLPLRSGGIWGDGHHHDHDHNHTAQHSDEHQHHHHDEEDSALGLKPHAVDPTSLDPHLWLDPQRVRQWLPALVAAFRTADPDHAAGYDQRAAELDQALIGLDADLRQTLSSVQGAPYLVFHDAYQYLESRYGLTPVGALTIDPGQAPGARRMSELRQQIKATNARCLFAEPQYSPTLLQRLAEGTGARVATADPLGQAAAGRSGFALYQQNLTALAAAFTDCLHP